MQKTPCGLKYFPHGACYIIPTHYAQLPIHALQESSARPQAVYSQNPGISIWISQIYLKARLTNQMRQPSIKTALDSIIELIGRINTDIQLIQMSNPKDQELTQILTDINAGKTSLISARKRITSKIKN